MPTNLEVILPFLANNHIYPESLERNKKKEVTVINVSCAPIMQDDKKAYLEKILDGKGVVVHRDTKNQVLVIREEKK